MRLEQSYISTIDMLQKDEHAISGEHGKGTRIMRKRLRNNLQIEGGESWNTPEGLRTMRKWQAILTGSVEGERQKYSFARDIWQPCGAQRYSQAPSSVH